MIDKQTDRSILNVAAANGQMFGVDGPTHYVYVISHVSTRGLKMFRSMT